MKSVEGSERAALTTSVPAAVRAVPKATVPRAIDAVRRLQRLVPIRASTIPYSSVRLAPSQASPLLSAQAIDRKLHAQKPPYASSARSKAGERSPPCGGATV